MDMENVSNNKLIEIYRELETKWLTIWKYNKI
jgi:hypothetical protein